MNENIKNLLYYIFTARRDNAETEESYQAWCTARDLLEYALRGDYAGLAQFDYMVTNAECDYYKDDIDH